MILKLNSWNVRQNYLVKNQISPIFYRPNIEPLTELTMIIKDATKLKESKYCLYFWHANRQLRGTILPYQYSLYIYPIIYLGKIIKRSP